MLTIARTLMGNPKLLLLDEPSEGIAPVIVEQMAETLLEIKAKGLTVLLSEQNLHFARIVADRAVIIEGGRRCLTARSPSWKASRKSATSISVCLNKLTIIGLEPVTSCSSSMKPLTDGR